MQHVLASSLPLATPAQEVVVFQRPGVRPMCLEVNKGEGEQKKRVELVLKEFGGILLLGLLSGKEQPCPTGEEE